MRASVTAVVVAYGAEPWLQRCVEALLASHDVDVDVVLVDNGCTDGAVDELRVRPRIQVIEPERNLGFAGGCNAGAAVASGDLIALVNPDAIVDPGALARMAEVLVDPNIGIATASLRLSDRPDLLNSGGNMIHFLGFGWVGDFEVPADHVGARDVASASGASMMMRSPDWRELGGFDEMYFAYHEDAELSWRCWQAGMRVRYVPEAIVLHRYEFSRTPSKMYLLERNRLIFMLTLFESRTLWLLLLPMVVLEVGMLAVAAAQGWSQQKLDGWRWLATNLRIVRARRRERMRQRRVPDRELTHLLQPRFDPRNFAMPSVLRPIDVMLGVYFRVIRPLI